jgi:hypothetical protein
LPALRILAGPALIIIVSLHATTPFPGSEFINELFVTAFLISNMLAEKGINSEMCTRNKTFQTFQELLYYNLKYRPITQQSLELMIEAFFCSYNFTSP